MVGTIHLRKENTALVIKPGEWAEVVIKTKDGDIILGSESRDKIISQLADALRSKNISETIGEISGVAVNWVVSFSERHCSIYVGDCSGMRHIFVQNENGNTVFDFQLSQTDVTAWLEILSCVSEDIAPA